MAISFGQEAPILGKFDVNTESYIKTKTLVNSCFIFEGNWDFLWLPRRGFLWTLLVPSHLQNTPAQVESRCCSGDRVRRGVGFYFTLICLFWQCSGPFVFTTTTKLLCVCKFSVPTRVLCWHQGECSVSEYPRYKGSSCHRNIIVSFLSNFSENLCKTPLWKKWFFRTWSLFHLTRVLGHH